VFENRAKAPTDRLRLFEPAAQGEKARVFFAFTLRPDGQSGKLYELADEPVLCEPVSARSSLLTGKFAGNPTKIGGRKPEISSYFQTSGCIFPL
jgi:hypothetical protein